MDNKRYETKHTEKSRRRDVDHSDFIAQYEENFIRFLKESPDTILTLEPMNSFRRRAIHKLAADFQFLSRSEGEDDTRHIIIEKTNDSRVPPIKATPIWNFGDKEFFVKINDKNGTEVALCADGTVGVTENFRQKSILARRTVKSGTFKIKFNAIVEFTDPDW